MSSDPLKPTETPTMEQQSLLEHVSPDLNHLNPLKSYLGIDQLDAKTSQQLDYIYKEIKVDKNLTDGDILMALKEVKLRVGYPRLGETMAGKIYNYLRAAEGVKEAEKRRNALLA